MSAELPQAVDVIVVGAGNAAFCAALAAREQGATVAGAGARAGGRSAAATAASPPGPFRVVYNGVDDIAR